MKRNTTRPKKLTNEQIIFQIAFVLAAFYIVGLLFSAVMGYVNQDENEPTPTDLVQIQEMLDYQRSEGRTNMKAFYHQD